MSMTRRRKLEKEAQRRRGNFFSLFLLAVMHSLNSFSPSRAKTSALTNFLARRILHEQDTVSWTPSLTWRTTIDNCGAKWKRGDEEVRRGMPYLPWCCDLWEQRCARHLLHCLLHHARLGLELLWDCRHAWLLGHRLAEGVVEHDTGLLLLLHLWHLHLLHGHGYRHRLLLLLLLLRHTSCRNHTRLGTLIPPYLIGLRPVCFRGVVTSLWQERVLNFAG